VDDNTRDVLVTLVSILGGLATGIVVARLGFSHARDTDRQRWQREDALRREDLDRARRDRWVDRRRQVCVAVAATAMTVQQMAVNHRAGRRIGANDYIPLLQAGFAATAELRLISESLADTGGDLLIAANEALMIATTERTQSLDPSTAQFTEALSSFMETARTDLQR
jgi:hypothetical protein